MKKPFLFALLLLSFGARAQQRYFQQRVDTKIEVRLDDRLHQLHGFEEFRYTNQSADTLQYLYVHLWPNGYKNDRTAFSEQQLRNEKTAFYYAPEGDRGFIDSLSFVVDGQAASYFSPSNTPDIARLDLPTLLLPGGTVKVATPFRVKIPVVFSRLGHTGQAYFISQWFPKPAVYDVTGWHPMPYLDQGEFYAEIGSYDVTITLPQNYVVMATGNCQTESENAWLDARAADSARVDSALGMKFPPSADALKTIRFTEDLVHDFAFFADKRFVVRKDTVTVPENGKVVTAWTAALPVHAKEWQKGTEALRQTILNYSKEVGPYPYATVKGVEGDMKAGGGMEYPTVTIIDRGAVGGLESVLIHEAGHNWFQGMLGSNERRNPWMDEGLNTFYEWKTERALAEMRADTARKETGIPNRNKLRTESSEALLYYYLVADGDDQALNLPSEDFRELNYGGDVYVKTALWMRWLEDWMGEEDFRKGMQEYFRRWAHKHPAPADFKEALQSVTTKDLNWFFDNAFATDRRLDFSLKRAGTGQGDSVQVRVVNKNNFAAPVKVLALQGDSVAASAWTGIFNGSALATLPAGRYSRIVLAQSIPDGKQSNNSTAHRVGLGLGIGISRSYAAKAWVTPALGYNTYDGFMVGGIFHNAFQATPPRLRFVAAPLYGFRGKELVGAGSVGYFWFPQRGLFQEWSLQADVKSFHFQESGFNTDRLVQPRFLKVAPELNFVFRRPLPRSTATNTLTLRGYAIKEEGLRFERNTAVDSLFRPVLAAGDFKVWGKVRFQHLNERAINPFSYAAEVHGNSDFVKASLEGKLRIDYHKKGKSLYLRGFGGKLFYKSGSFLPQRFQLQSTYTATNDYLYDGTYVGRSAREGFGSHQIGILEGGLKVPAPRQTPLLGSSDNWLGAINISSDLPLGNLPLRLFADVATFSDAGRNNPSGSKLLYDAGVSVHVLGDLVSLYWPFVLSTDYSDYYKGQGGASFGRTFVFQVNLHQVNWLKMTRKALKAVM